MWRIQAFWVSHCSFHVHLICSGEFCKVRIIIESLLPGLGFSSPELELGSSGLQQEELWMWSQESCVAVKILTVDCWVMGGKGLLLFRVSSAK